MEWRRARDAGALAGLTGQPRTAKRTPEQVELERLRRDKAKVEAELARTKAALDIVGKAHALLELLSERGCRDAVEEVIAPAVIELAERTSTARACALLGWSRATHYRAQQPQQPSGPAVPRPAPPNALTDAEREQVLARLNSTRFADKSVAQTWATLLDEGIYWMRASTCVRCPRCTGCCGPPGSPGSAGGRPPTRRG